MCEIFKFTLIHRFWGLNDFFHGWLNAIHQKWPYTAQDLMNFKATDVKCIRWHAMAQNTFIKTHGNNLTHPEHTSRHNVLTKHFHMAWLQPDFSLRAKALWVVKWLFLWPPQWSWFPVRSYSVSVCVIRSAGISSSHLTVKRDQQKPTTVIPAAWSGTKTLTSIFQIIFYSEPTYH